MGYGSFSTASYNSMSSSRGYASKSVDQIFTSRNINDLLNPKKMTNKIRESRDSEEHPESLPIIIGLDVTGSMGKIPYNLVQGGLPKLMDNIIATAHKDPQLMFIGIGDSYFDSAPIQISQFESSTELIDQSLTSLFIERGGGGNLEESYSYAWLIGARHTSADRFEKHNKKGFIFTIGDERLNNELYEGSLIHHMGYESGQQSILSKDLYREVSEKYHVFHIHCTDGSYPTNVIEKEWKEILGENFISCKSDEIVAIISNKIKQILDLENNKYIASSDPTKETKSNNPTFL